MCCNPDIHVSQRCQHKRRPRCGKRRRRIRELKACASPIKYKRCKRESKRKKQKNSGDSGCNYHDDDDNKLYVNYSLDPEFGGGGGGEIVVLEILSRLPVKSLMRFKCVCKRWLFLIEEDPYFAHLHLSQAIRRPPSLLISLLKPVENPRDFMETDDYVVSECTMFFMTADLLLQGKGGAVSAAVVHTTREIDTPLYGDRVLGPVNGLMCFHDPQFNFGVRIFNVSTREVTPWIEYSQLGALREEERRSFRSSRIKARCALGFNPATKEHKVICITTYFDVYRTHSVIGEILTVGDNKWRRVDEVPAYMLNHCLDSVYINGSIYYSYKNLVRAMHTHVNDMPDFIVAFDLGTETFREMKVPDFILNQPQENYRFHKSCIGLLEVGGLVALLGKMDHYTVKLWLYDDADDYKKENHATCSTNNKRWSEVTIGLPYFWGIDRCITFDSVVGTDMIILRSYQYSHGQVSNLSHHSYNWKNNSFEEIVISSIPSSVPYGSSCSSTTTTFYESLLHVQ